MVRRHRALVTGIVVVMLILAGGMVATARPSLSALDVDLPGDGGAATLPSAAVAADPLPPASEFFVKPGGDDINYCSSWEYACETIQGALDYAGPGATIYVQKGQYHESAQVCHGVTIIGGQEPPPEPSSSPLQPPGGTEILGTAGHPPVVVCADDVTLTDLVLGPETLPLNGAGGWAGNFAILLCTGSSNLHLENVEVNYPVEVQLGWDEQLCVCALNGWNHNDNH